jgi:cytochrome b6-f complex iron-sulfur subunit
MEEVKDKSTKHEASPVNKSKRNFLVTAAWGGFAAVMAGSTVALGRFFFPRVLFEPPSKFKIGKPSDFLPNTVDTRFMDKFGVWIVRNESDGIYAIRSVCSHLGCTPNWLETQKKFKCPCHGSGFIITGMNVEGPAPRPLDRFKISRADDGDIEIDKGIIFVGIAGIDPSEKYPLSILAV